MTFPCHGAVTFSVTAYIANKLHFSKASTIAASSFFAFFAMLPDVGSWFIETMKGLPRWSLYSEFHSGATYQFLKWTGSYYVHCILDKLVHPFNEHVALYIGLEVMLWIAAASFVYPVFVEWQKTKSPNP